MPTHALVMATATAFFVPAIAVGHDEDAARAVGTAGLVLTLGGFAILAAGGTIGGSITYVHGIRVVNLVRQACAEGDGAEQRPEKEKAARG